jgi:uncharacterized protein
MMKPCNRKSAFILHAFNEYIHNQFNGILTMATALITGASSGIGLELSRQFAAGKHDLVLVARNQDRLQSLADELQHEHGINVHVIAMDLALANAAAALHEALGQRKVGIDYLVNNAGFGQNELFAEMPLADALQMIQLNITTLTQLTHLLLPQMLARGSGKVLNIASTAAFMPGPTQAVYFATKAYVLSFSEAIADELQGSGVSVTVYCPGPTRTGFASRANMTNALLFKLNPMSAEAVAQDAYRAMMRGKSLAIAGLVNQLQIFSIRLSPRWLVRKVTRALTDGRA